MASDTTATRKRKANEALAGVVDDAKIMNFLESIERGMRQDTAPAAAAAAAPATLNAPLKPQADMPPPVYFDVVRANENGGSDLLGRLDLSGATQLTFGRDPTRVDIPLEHASISRHHATMTFDRNAVFISDFNSTHGTYVTRRGATTEKRLVARELMQIEPGDTVRFGESSRRYALGIAPPQLAEPEPPKPPAEVTVSIRIPSTSVGRLVGRGGATIHAVQERTGASVEVVARDRRDEYDRSTFRQVNIRGSMQAVAAARLELLAITAGEAPPIPRGGAPQAGAQRFRYASTVISSRDVDDDLLDSR